MIRKATKKDIRKIAKLMIEEFSKPPFNEKTKINSAIKSLNFYFKIGKTFVATENELVGVIIFKVEQWWEGPVILVEDLAVRQNSKKNDIEKRLMDEVEKYGKKIKASSVRFITNSKSSAVNFYIKQGYTMEKNRVLLYKNIK